MKKIIGLGELSLNKSGISGHCVCRSCRRKIKENQIEIPSGAWKGTFNYAKYHRECFIKEIIKHLSIEKKEFKDLREIALKEEIIENLEAEE